MDKEELGKMSKAINEYAKKYKCRIELEEYEKTYIDHLDKFYGYKLIAIKEDKIES